MKCWSRSTLGVVVGIINVLSYAVASIIIMRSLVRINKLSANQNTSKFDPELTEIAVRLGNAILFVLLVICLVMATLSGFLIKGIITRRHSLMIPWLVISAIGFVCSAARFFYTGYLSMVLGANAPYLSSFLIIGFFILGFQFLILYKIYKLYKDIRAKYHEQPLQIVTNGQMVLHNNHSNIHDNGFIGFNVAPPPKY